MSTTRYTIAEADGWVQVAASGDDFMLEMETGGLAYIHLAESEPAADAAYHRMRQLDVMVRTGTGAVYVRNPGPRGDISVVVTT